MPLACLFPYDANDEDVVFVSNPFSAITVITYDYKTW